MKKLRYLFGLILLAAVFVLILPELKATIPQIPKILENSNKYLIAVILFFQLLTYVSDTWLSQILLKIAGYRIAFSKIFKISIVDTLANLAIPFIGAQVVKYYLYRKLKVSTASIFFLMASWSIFWYISAALFFSISVFLIPQSDRYISLKIAFFAFIVLVFLVYWLLRRGNKILFSLFRILLHTVNAVSLKLRKKELVQREAIDNFINKLQITFAELRAAKKVGILAILAATLYYWADIITVYFSFWVFGYHPNIFLLIFGFTLSSILSLLTAIPFLPGVTESSMALIFVKLGFPAGPALLASILFRIVSYWLPMPLGIASYFDFRRETKKTKEIFK